jgi:enoyl-CoA hydratase/carnithine racemase
VNQFEHIRFDVNDRIATITLCRPEALNAFTAQMGAELLDAFDRTDADDDIRAVIVTGEGDRGFCAGADLSAGAATFADDSSNGDNETEAPLDPGGLVAIRIFRSLKPVLGAINGAAVGIGATLTLPMDIRLAATSARFGFVFARRGLVPEGASSWFLPRIVGISRALEWSYAGQLLSAEEVRDAGLVRSLHAPADLVAAAHTLALTLTESSSPVSITLTRQMMWRMLGANDPTEAHRIDSRALYALGGTADVREGIASFLERRPPQFTSRVSSDIPAMFDGWFEPPVS